MRAKLIAFPLMISALVTVAGASAPALAQTTLFEGARLIPGDGSPAIENSAFVVQNNRFTAVGRRGEVQAPAGAARVDLSGKTVMPTMVDMHGHFGFQNIPAGTMSK
jgi:imidazolonepropionase-like amidohydrolase